MARLRPSALALLALASALGAGRLVAQAAPAPTTGPAAAPFAPSPSLTAALAELAPRASAKGFAAELQARAASLPAAEGALLLERLGPGLADPLERRRLLLRAGDLEYLLGAFAAAAGDYEAALAPTKSGGGLPSAEDIAILLRTGRSWLAAGEGEKAGRIAALLLASSTDPLVQQRAGLLAAWAAWLGGNPSTARALALPLAAATGAPAELQREGRFLLWILGTKEEREALGKTLRDSAPGSPEAYLVSQTGPAISLRALPHWYFGGLLPLPPAPTETLPPAGLSVPPSAPPAAAPLSGAAPPGPAPVPPAAPAASPTPAAPPPQKAGASGREGSASPAAAAESEAPLRWQVGVFSKSANAQALVAELVKKGFAARIEVRKTAGQDLFAVLVDAGKGGADLGARLRDAGYEVWPLFK